LWFLAAGFGGPYYMSIQNAAGNAANCTYVASAIFDCIMREVRILNVAGGCCDC